MHVGLNLIYLVPGETGGTEVVARELLPALAAGTDATFTCFMNLEAAAAADPFWSEWARVVTVPVRARNRLQWVRGEQQLLPRLAEREQVDVVHSLGNTGPAWGGFRRVVTIHDLIHRIHPEAHFGLRVHGMRILVSLAARRSDRVIADSSSTRDDLIRLLDLAPDKVDVVPLGLGSTGHVEAEPQPGLRARLGAEGRQVVLTVSAKRPHKNLMRLLDALASIPPERRPLLVLPGYRTPYEPELERHAGRLGISADVRFLDWVGEAELEGLYRLADAFVFPSLYEGFGLPVLEAMQRGVPVACSNRSSLPEVAGGAALLFDPEITGQIAAAIETLLHDRSLAERLRSAARTQAGLFTWEATAAGTMECYERALGRKAAQIA